MEGGTARPNVIWLNFLLWIGVIFLVWRGWYSYAAALAGLAVALALVFALGRKLQRKIKERPKDRLPPFDDIDFDKIKPSDFED